MTPERIFALKVDGLVRFILAVILTAVLALGAVELCAGPSTAPGIPSTIGNGAQSGPGFAPMQRGSVVDVGAAPRSGLYAEFLAGNWHLNGSNVDIWYDSSGNARNATQPIATSQPKATTSGVQNNDSGDYLTVPAMDSNLSSMTVVIAWTATSSFSDFMVLFQLNSAYTTSMIEARAAYEEAFPTRTKIATYPADYGKNLLSGWTFNYSPGTNQVYTSIFSDGSVLDSTVSAISNASIPITIGNSHHIDYGPYTYGTRHLIRAIWIYARILTSEELASSVDWRTTQ